MIYLIKLFFFLLLSNSAIAKEDQISKILFKINNKVFTNIDLEKRTDYIKLISNLETPELTEEENKEILDDYISSLIFYEYYNQNNIFYNNLNTEVDLIYEKKFKNYKQLDQIDIKNFKIHTSIDLIRNKIIEKKLNLNKNSLLQEANKPDLLYNYNLQYIIIREDLVNIELIKNIDDEKKFNDLKKFLTKNKINFFFKEEDIINNSVISKNIKNIINQNIQIYNKSENGYINVISIKKNLESYEGIFVKLINFKSNSLIEKKDLQCDKLNEKINNNKTIFKEYEYSKLNNKIKNNLKSINDYIILNENDEFNYIILCDLTYDENLLKNINFNKNVNSLVNKIQKQFLKKYKNEYKFKKIK